MKKDFWERAEELLHTALERSPEARRAFLDKACGEDTELRRQVETLLTQDEQAGSFLAKPALAEAAAKMMGNGDPMSMIGKALGRYAITSKLGEGGMGIVYLAHDTSLDRKVAIKFLPEFLKQDETARKRFNREARSAAALDHPFICAIHEIGEAEGKSFIVMEYLEGQTLQNRLAQGVAPLKQAMQWAAEISEALTVAHEKGIMHRDLKPANIMLLQTGHAKVMDFGLAKQMAMSPDAGDMARTLTNGLTREGTTVGTIPYMSPEQVQGKTVDLRSDLFSFGIVLYEMLTGANPFTREAAFDTAAAIVRETPAPISKYRNDVPQSLVAIIHRLLAKDPNDRYQHAREVTAALQNAIDEASGPKIVATLPAFAGIWKTLKKPVCMIPIILVSAVAVYFSVLGVKTYQKRKWAREVVPKEVERLVKISPATENDLALSLIDREKATNVIAAFNLVRDARTALPADAELDRLWNLLSEKISVTTQPGGARIYARPYRFPKESWQFWGISPFQGRVARILWRCKLEKEEHETLDALMAKQFTSMIQAPLSRILDKKGQIPSGMVRIGSRKIENIQLVDFFLDKYEVTNKQFREFVRAGGYQNQSYWKHEFLKNGKKITWAEAMSSFTDLTGRPGPATWQAGDYYSEDQADFPVAGVSWYEAAAYAEFVKKSLPTIYHWAAPNLYPSWDVFWPNSIIVPLSNLGSAGALRVGSCEGINFYGIYDMAGNAREWCLNQAPEGRTLRGGAWNDYPYMFSFVTWADSFDRSPKNGFRCAYYPEPGKIPEAAFGPVLRAKLREFAKERPVSDDIFEVYKNQFSYDKADLNVKPEAFKESEHWIMEKVSFDAAYDKERMLAYLFLPKNSKPSFQVVICFPGIGALSREASAISDLPDFFLKSGRAVLLPIYNGTYERSEGLPYPDTSNKHREYLIKLGKDFSRSIDYLGSRSDMDMHRIAFYGLSWGACMSPVLPAIEPRVKASISILGGFWNNWPYGFPPEADQFNYAPRVKVPVLMLNGEYDSIFPYEANVKPMFNLLGTSPKDKFLKLYHTDHSIPRNELIKESLWFLDRYFGPVKSSQ